MSTDPAFPRLVSLACHDLRTPLATVAGFAHTLARQDGLAPPADRYVEMMITASGEIAELLDGLGLLARIEAGRYDPARVEADSLALARAAAARLGEEKVGVTGHGGPVAVDSDAVQLAVYGLVRCTLRHGGLERVSVAAEGPELRISPVTEAAAPIVTAQDIRDLGAAVGLRIVAALGGSAELDGETLVVRLPRYAS
jgi:light-regulated signal transduction histidine kinase (bacteriophytochrome)